MDSPVACMRQVPARSTVWAACRARAMAIPSRVRMREIGFELGEGGEDIEASCHGIARVVERRAGQFQNQVGDGAGIRRTWPA